MSIVFYISFHYIILLSTHTHTHAWTNVDDGLFNKKKNRKNDVSENETNRKGLYY